MDTFVVEKLIRTIKKNYIQKYLEENNVNGENNLSEGQIEEVYEIFRGNIADGKYDDPIVNNTVGFYYHSLFDFKNSEKYYLFAVDQNYPMAMLNLGNLYYLNKKYDLVEVYMKMAFDNGIVEAGYLLGVICDEQNKLDLAEKYLLMCYDDSNVKLVYLLGNVYYKLGKFEIAESYYLKAVGVNNGEAANNLACIYLSRDERDLAEKYYLIAIEQGCTCAEYNLGFLYQISKKYDLAEKYYLNTLERNPNCVDTMRNLATTYHQSAQYELAEKFYLKAVSKNDRDSLFNLEILYEGNILKLFDSLGKLLVEGSKNDVLVEKYEELSGKYVVRCFQNKKKLLVRLNYCSICMEDDVPTIPMECVHYFCFECYVNLNCCPICEIEKYI
ncbi:MAG: hypothetical protein Hyperionvirus12_2 [Hyperionvirus sp.]|uniref:RING-type domain-containing protein n=1 Tax=Hyperionvirus sp. TaxID=2487770 RepID=A0A3G5A997_9VIRU|nr:MAG: hypothetical protein Hyperionvirus12_2 [Hyperionvirus sp.]